MAGKTILVLSYWPFHDVLTQGAILPHVKILYKIRDISKIVLITIEREDLKSKNSDFLAEFKRVKHYGLLSKNYSNGLLNKVNDFLIFPYKLIKIAKEENVDVILASGTLAGTLAYKVWEKSRIPFYVLFEPHSAYMLDSKVWCKYDPRYIFQNKWENEQLQFSSGLLVVTENYRKYLLGNHPEIDAVKVLLGRNPVEASLFKFSDDSRKKIRRSLGIRERTLAGIYVGKFGGLYYEDEAFQIYLECFKLIPDFKLIILSPQPTKEILGQLRKYKIDSAKVYITLAKHSQVAAFLSAADFAFATIKSYPSARFCSPVKIGEYWANGLPVLLTEGVGDDSDIIKNEGGGALFNLQQAGSLEKAIEQIQTIVRNPNHRYEIPKLALEYRSPEKIREAYEYFFAQLATSEL